MNFMDKLIRAGALLMLTGFAAAAVCLYFDVPTRLQERRPANSAGPNYTCPMHAEIVRDHPDDCPKCGMALTAANQAAAGHDPCGNGAENHPGCCTHQGGYESATELRLPPGHPPIPGGTPNATPESKPAASSDATHSSH